jgi:hypothetical protein
MEGLCKTHGPFAYSLLANAALPAILSTVFTVFTVLTGVARVTPGAGGEIGVGRHHCHYTQDGY